MSDKSRGKILVVGAKSLIGSKLLCVCEEQNLVCLGSCRDEDCQKHLTLDLCRPKQTWEVPEDTATAVICASITNQKYCELHPDLSYRVNVCSTIELLKILNQKGIRVVFLSTNLVLPCTRPKQHPETKRDPIGAYAKQKAEVETFIENKISDFAIIRLGKVIAPQNSLMMEWQNKILINDDFEPYNNLFISPISLEFAVDGILKVAKSSGQGIYQISGSEEVSYYEFAIQMSEAMGFCKPKNIRAGAQISSEDFFANPKHPSMDCSRLTSDFGIASEPLSELIEKLLV